MKNWTKFLLPVLTIIAILVIAIYGIIIKNKIAEYSYAKRMEKIAKANEKTTFSIDKIYVCSSANAEETKDMKNLQIYQYTDIAIYLNNNEENLGLIDENIIKKLYIDEIQINGNKEIGEQYFAYSNLFEIGDKRQTMNLENNDRIDFQIVYNNQENDEADYSNPTFYTDCSNPITLRYINNINSNYNLEENSSVKFDGSLLKSAGISVEELGCNLNFRINILTNDDKEHSCTVNFNIPLNDIYNGTTIKTANKNVLKYNFFKNF